MNKLPISVFIITKDEEERLPKAILSVKDWVDEVIVVDSGSEDATVDIAEKLGAKAIFNEWKGYGPQKLFGEKLAKNDWILNIDADEEVSEELRDEIIELFKGKEPKEKGFFIRWKIMFFFEDKPPMLAPGDNILRLYNKKHASFSDSLIHDRVHFINKEDKVGQLKNILLHRCFKSYEHWLDKINFYSTMQAEDKFKKGQNVSGFRVILEPPLAFFKAYILRRYFIYGIEGVIYSLIYSYAKLIRLAKIRKRFKQKDL